MRHLLLLAFATIGAPVFAQRCRTCAPVVTKAATVVTQAVPVIQKETPQIFIINGSPGVPAGTTQYNYSQYPNLNLIDVDRLATQAIQMQQAAASSQSDYHAETLQFLAKIVELQRPIAETIAKGQAAQQVIDALDEVQEAGPENGTQGGPKLLQQTCLRCHSGDAAKGGFRLDEPFDGTKAILQITSGQMPPDRELRLDERLLLISEIVNQ